jgi:SH3-like domain-containing protein
MKSWTALTLSLLALVGCTGQKAPEQARQATPPPPAPTALVVYDGIGIRKQPSDDKALKGNVFTSVDRGEKVAVLGDTTGWTKVRLSDDKEGWIKTDMIRTGVEKMAVMTEAAQVFLRPDISSRGAVVDTPYAMPGTIVWVFKEKDGFYECEFLRNKKGWVKVGVLSEDPADLEAARLLEQARKYMKREQPALATGYYQQIVDKYAATKVAQLVPLESDVEPKPQGE